MLDRREFRLLVQCCRFNFAASAAESLQIDGGLEWPLFVNLARFHRVQGFAWNALAKSDIPVEAATALSGDARIIAATNLAIARECNALATAFTSAGLPLLFLKGLTVGALAYRSPLLKMGWDIDLLIAPNDLLTAAGLLRSRGLSLRLPAKPDDLERWHGWSKESVWSRPDNIHVELHTRVADNLALVPELNVFSPRQLVEIAADTALPTFAQDELFAYLAVHGASSAWFRLKWISDFAALLETRTGNDLDHLYGRSLQLGAGRAAGQALLLADRLFGTLNRAPRLRTELETTPGIRGLAAGASHMLGRRPVDPTRRCLGTFAIHWTQFFLLPGPRYKASELRRQVVGLFKERQA
jgi:hypothetical protein